MEEEKELQSNGQNSTRDNKGVKENLYDKIPLTLKQLNIIIAILIVAIIVFFALGVLKGNGVM